jgi:hypothetical protein
VNLVAASFSWPFRGRWQSRWAVGVLSVLLLPIAFIPLLGYAIAATRSAVSQPKNGPPPWAFSRRLLTDGFWSTLVLVLISTPFALVLDPLSNFIQQAHVWHVSDQSLSDFYAHLAATAILALPWGLVLLLLMPHAASRFAVTGRPRDIFDFVGAVRGVRRDFVTWNLAAAAMVTAWAIAVACAGFFCVGIVPGIFYAILVSAHAGAALQAKGPDPSTR